MGSIVTVLLGDQFVFCSTSDDSYLVIGKCNSTSNLKQSFAVPLDYPG